MGGGERIKSELLLLEKGQGGAARSLRRAEGAKKRYSCRLREKVCRRFGSSPHMEEKRRRDHRGEQAWPARSSEGCLITLRETFRGRKKRGPYWLPKSPKEKDEKKRKKKKKKGGGDSRRGSCVPLERTQEEGIEVCSLGGGEGGGVGKKDGLCGTA